MGQIERLTPALMKAHEEGIDLSQLYERLSLTPTERIQRNLQMIDLVQELRKAGQQRCDQPQN